jgi:5-bromo-4-chloroindolyl phosphate hydrolysis protein
LNEAERTRDPAGWADVVAGLVGGLFAPVATFGFGLPLWVSLPAAVLIFVGIRLAIAPRRLFEGFDFGEADRASIELARGILSGAQRELDRLKALAQETSTIAVRNNLDHLYAVAARVVAEVEQKPRRVNNVRRLLTYYLPAAVRLAAGYHVLEGSITPDRERVQATAEMIGRLDEVFGRYADRLSEEEVEGLDVELRLLENSIRDEQRLLTG